VPKTARKLHFPPGVRASRANDGFDKPPIDASAEGGFQELLSFIYRERGWDFRDYKPKSLKRRLSRKLCELGIPSFHGYISYLGSNPSELDSLLTFLTIKVSEFFREPEVFDSVCALCCDRLRSPDGLRVWSCGCANGEEAYSIAMLLSECLPAEALKKTRVFATDIDREAVERARRAVYREEFLRNVSPPLKERHLFEVGGLFKVKYNIRNLVRFGTLDIVTGCPLKRIDLLFCRNLLIYMDKGLQESVFNKLDYALAPGGILVLGRSEVVPNAYSSRYTLLSKKMSIYRKAV